MNRLFEIIKLLMQQRFSGTLEIEFFEGGVRSSYKREKVI